MALADIVILGAGGFAREVAALIEQINSVTPRWRLLAFYDSKASGKDMMRNVPVVGSQDIHAIDRSTAFVVGIGSPQIKKRAAQEMMLAGFQNLVSLVHPSVLLDTSASIGRGALVFSGAVVSVDVTLQVCATVYYGCTIGHDSTLGSYVQLSPGCNISGSVVLEEGVFMGTNSAVIENIRIGAWAKVGAGAVVISDVTAGSTVVGVPAVAIGGQRS